MPLSRFSQVSRYRNAVLSTSKPEERFSELSLASTPDSGSGKLLAISPISSHIFIRSSTSSNSLIVLPHTATRKYAKLPPLLNNACTTGQLGDFDLCNFQNNQDEILLAAGSLQGDITLQHVRLPLHGMDTSSFTAPITMPAQDTNALVLKTPMGKSVNLLHFHPTVSSLFFTASNQDGSIHVWDSAQSFPVLQYDSGCSQWDTKWSLDGRQIASIGKDTLVRLWDPRSTKESAIIKAHVSKVKSGKVTFIQASQPHLLLTTGFSQMRQREIAIHDQRNASSPLKRIILDVASSALEPLCDYDRGIVYMIAKGESTVRWVDVGSEDQGGNFAEGAHALNFTATSAVLGPSFKVDVGVGEVAKLFIASSPGSSGGGASSSDSIIPASIRVPRRTYIDFHSDLYPLTPSRTGSGQGSEDWLKGNDSFPPLQSLDPAKHGQIHQNGVKNGNTSTSDTPSKPLPQQTIPSQQSMVKSAISSKDALTQPIQIRDTISEALNTNHSIDIQEVTSSSTFIPREVSAPTKDEDKAATLTANSTTVAPLAHWSRRFLAGATPLVPSFQNLTSLDLSRAPASRMLIVSTDYLLLPISGPGGRLGVHPLQKEGRLPFQMPSFQHGAVLGDFTMDPFHQDQVITSAGDDIIRLWKIPALPVEGEEWPSNLAEKPLVSIPLPTNQGSNKVGELCPHSHADGLVAVIPSDSDGKIHLLNLRSAAVKKSINVPTQGLHGAVWSPDGSVLAGAGKDRNLYILDVRGKGQTASTLGHSLAHDSPRPFNIVWIDNYHLLTVGHTTGSLRQLKLFKIDHTSQSGLVEVANHNLDVSPSILFPFWDEDVNILWLWSKGERLISSFEVQPDNVKEPFLALSAFQHNHPQLGLAFLRKDCVNVREVEVECSIRLCKEELQRVAWKISRSRPEYFQDDIYQPSAIVERPLIDCEQWLEGKDAPPASRKSLQPEGMMPLSHAPPVVRTSKLPKGPIRGEKTDKEREEEALNSIFVKAKGNDEGKDPNHNEDQAARAPDDDDWGDSD